MQTTAYRGGVVSLGDEVSEVSLETSRSTRAWLAVALIGGLVLLVSAFVADDAMPDRMFRGIVGVASSSYFGAYFVWALSHRIRTSRDGLISQSIVGTIVLRWRDVDAAGFFAAGDQPTAKPGQARPGDRAPAGRDFLVESRALKQEIKIRDDLEPAAARVQLIELIERLGPGKTLPQE